MISDEKKTAWRKLARDLTHETLHGAPPVKVTMELAIAVMELLDECDRACRELDEVERLLVADDERRHDEERRD